MTETERNYTRCFSSPSGMAVLQHLRQITIDRVLGANCSDFELRWLEAQRSLIHYIETLVQRGRGQHNDNT